MRRRSVPRLLGLLVTLPLIVFIDPTAALGSTRSLIVGAAQFPSDHIVNIFTDVGAGATALAATAAVVALFRGWTVWRSDKLDVRRRQQDEWAETASRMAEQIRSELTKDWVEIFPDVVKLFDRADRIANLRLEADDALKKLEIVDDPPPGTLEPALAAGVRELAANLATLESTYRDLLRQTQGYPDHAADDDYLRVLRRTRDSALSQGDAVIANSHRFDSNVRQWRQWRMRDAERQLHLLPRRRELPPCLDPFEMIAPEDDPALPDGSDNAEPDDGASSATG